MTAQTQAMIEAALKSDPTLTPSARRMLADQLRAGAEGQHPDATEAARLIGRAEAGRILNRTPRSISHLAAQGILHPVKMPGRVRGGGFRLRDVLSLVEA
jgi:hypothetical protein